MRLYVIVKMQVLQKETLCYCKDVGALQTLYVIVKMYVPRKETLSDCKDVGASQRDLI